MKYDAIVIGGGHNGLGAATYLAARSTPRSTRARGDETTTSRTRAWRATSQRRRACSTSASSGTGRFMAQSRPMRPQHLVDVFAIALALSSTSLEGTSFAEDAREDKPAKTKSAPKPWCGPDVTELSDHVCFFEGEPPASGRRTRRCEEPVRPGGEERERDVGQAGG